MSITKRARRLAILTVSVGVATVGALAPASASSYSINQLVNCHVYEQVELQGSPAHDYMRWTTSGGSKGCEAEINREYNGVWTVVEDRTITTTGSDSSAWYYDGPGYTAQVDVLGTDGSLKFGPLN